jgi:hypothetical protein
MPIKYLRRPDLSEVKTRREKQAEYEKKHRAAFAPAIRVIITKDEGQLLDKVQLRRGVAKGGYPAALLRHALVIEDLGGDAVRVLETARDQLEAVRAGKTNVTFFKPTGTDHE